MTPATGVDQEHGEHDHASISLLEMTMLSRRLSPVFILVLVLSPSGVAANDVWVTGQTGWSSYFTNNFDRDASFDSPARAAFGVHITPRLSVGLLWERHEAFSAQRDTFLQQQVEEVLEVDHFDRTDETTFADRQVDLGADVYLLTLQFHEEHNRWLSWSWGGGMGVVVPRGDIELRYANRSDLSTQFEGHTLMFQAFASLEAYPFRAVGFTTMLGLRSARVSRVEAGGQALLDDSGSEKYIDYTGLYGFLGIKFRIDIL